MDIKSLIAGLGNPGEKYAHTRHNFGFECVDHILRVARERKSMKLEQLKDTPDYQLWRVHIAGGVHLLQKPLTYMNLSGDAVARVSGQYALKPEQVFVMHDELDLELGRVKCKKGGGNNGHNGLESIEQRLGTPAFHRIRLGIGRPQEKWEVTDWVLGRFSEEDIALVDDVAKAVFKWLDLYHRRGPQVATQYLHGIHATRAD